MLRYYEDLGFKKKRLSTFMSKKSVIPQARSPTMAMASGHSSKILFQWLKSSSQVTCPITVQGLRVEGRKGL